MVGEIFPIVPAGIEVKFVGDVALCEQVMEFLAAFVESKIVFRAAIEINLQPRGARAGLAQS